MAHIAPPAIRRPADRLVGFLSLMLGLSLAFISYTALHHPRGRQAGLLRPLASAPAVVPGSAVAAGHPSASHSSSGAHSPVTDPAGYALEPGTGSGSSARASLIVLDNTGHPALAHGASALFAQAGWTVTATGTFDGDILSTAAYYDPATDGAQAAAEALQKQFPVIQRVRPRFAGLPQGPIVVVLTYDYSRGQTTS